MGILVIGGIEGAGTTTWLALAVAATEAAATVEATDGGSGGHPWWRRRPPTTAATLFGVDKWRFHGRFAAARGGAHDIEDVMEEVVGGFMVVLKA